MTSSRGSQHSCSRSHRTPLGLTAASNSNKGVEMRPLMRPCGPAVLEPGVVGGGYCQWGKPRSTCATPSPSISVTRVEGLLFRHTQKVLATECIWAHRVASRGKFLSPRGCSCTARLQSGARRWRSACQGCCLPVVTSWAISSLTNVAFLSLLYIFRVKVQLESFILHSVGEDA